MGSSRSGGRSGEQHCGEREGGYLSEVRKGGTGRHEERRDGKGREGGNSRGTAARM